MNGESMLWLHLLSSSLAKATPLLLAAFGGLISELAGVVNFALEGMMLAGAFGAVWASYETGSPWIGLMAGALGGACIAILHATACLQWRANQIVSSIALNLLASGVTGLLLHQVFKAYGTSPSVAAIPYISSLNLVDSIPMVEVWMRPLLDNLSVMSPITLCIVLFLIAMIQWSVLGLRLRACGENPLAAESAGIAVFRLRFLTVFCGGALAGLGGAYLAICELSQFVENMTRGRGYLAVAALILGRWRPLGVFAAAVLFGAGEACSEWLAVRLPQFPYQIFLVLPYLACTLALLVPIGKRPPPSSLGRL
jgi:simple sugar transport system permease protein